MNQKLTVEDGKKALVDHVSAKALDIVEKYGVLNSLEQLNALLKDSSFIRFPVEVQFIDAVVDGETFGFVDKKEENPSGGYIINLHQNVKDDEILMIAMTMYLLVTVNYGDFAGFEEAEVFGSISMGMDKEEYYQMLCNAVDNIHGKHSHTSGCQQ